jgi:hypothetical protein
MMPTKTPPNATETAPLVDYVQCEWVSGSERCRFPGAISDNTTGAGPYWCCAHYGCSDGALGAAIVERSRRYRHPTRQERLEAFRARGAPKAWPQVAETGKTAWAHRILKAFELGDRDLPTYAVDLARSALSRGATNETRN